MEWLNNFIKKNPVLALIMPTGMGIFTFLGNLSIALSDGQLDSNEIHQLMGSASGVESLILIVIILALKSKDKGKK